MLDADKYKHCIREKTQVKKIEVSLFFRHTCDVTTLHVTPLHVHNNIRANLAPHSSFRLPSLSPRHVPKQILRTRYVVPYRGKG